MTKFFIVPGFQNSLGLHWQNLWVEKFSFQRIEQLNWDYPNCNDWIQNLYTQVLNYPNCILIGHSLGCIAIVNLAKACSINIKGALLVAVPDPKNPNFPSQCTNFETINYEKLNFKSIVVASTNDPYADIEHAKKYALFWGSEFINIGNKGHINMDSNLGNWDYGLNLVNYLDVVV